MAILSIRYTAYTSHHVFKTRPLPARKKFRKKRLTARARARTFNFRHYV
jgi:hypothetical protein